MTKRNWKQIIISIIIGACVAFFSTLFEGLAEFFKAHSTEIISGGTTTLFHIIKNIKA